MRPHDIQQQRFGVSGGLSLRPGDIRSPNREYGGNHDQQ